MDTEYLNERWVDIENTDGFYSISDFGNVRNNKTNKFLRKYNTNGYFSVNLKFVNKSSFTLQYVHRLVAEYFIENPNNYPEVNHIVGVDEVRAETPDELELSVKSMGIAAILEVIGKERAMKHFGIAER